MRLWDWSVAAYARPGVAPACLALQDDHGQNVPFLLFAAWGASADPQQLIAAARIAEAWEDAAVGPLRAVRRSLKRSHPPIADAAREALRDKVKAAELQAERALLEALEPLASPRGEAALFDALHAAVVIWDAPAPPREALARLASALA